MIDKKGLLIGGTFVTYKQGDIIFSYDDETSENGVFFIEKGKIELSFLKQNKEEFKIYLKDNSLFGLPEVYAEIARITKAKCLTDCVLYKWTKSGFLLAVSMSWELSLLSINSLSKMLKTLNYEFLKDTKN